jgi:Fe-S cluster assembly scaffold protein SufB
MQNESDQPLNSAHAKKGDATADNANNVENIKKSLEKEPSYGGYVDLKQFHIPDEAIRTDRLTDLDSMIQKSLTNVGIAPDGKNKSGNFLMYNNKVSHHSSAVEGLELMPMSEALKKHDWLKDYYWKLMDPNTDKYTAKSYLEGADGYFIRVLPNVVAGDPVQSCLMIGAEKSLQAVHSMIIVEEGASLEIVTGCVTHDDVKRALHIGVTEIYIKKGGKLTFSMIHNWDELVEVRPRTAIRIEENGQMINNYVCLKPARTIQTNPAAYLVGEGASAYFNTIAVAHPGAVLDMGSRVFLNAPNTKTEILSRTLTLGGEIIARGDIIANASNVYGHLECNGLVMDENGKQKAIPVLEANALDVEMTHEASIGRIAKDQVEYLMTRGLSEGEATGLIVRGFLSAGIEGIPENLKEEIADIVKKTENAS